MLSDTRERRSPADAAHIDEAKSGTSQFNFTACAGMISGFGKFHTNKNGDKPYVRIILEDIRTLVDSPPAVSKDDAQWLIPSTLESRIHVEQEANGQFWALWADVDWKELLPRPLSDVVAVVADLVGHADHECYASKSATQDRQKCRVLIPLGKPLCGRDWIMAQRVLNRLLADAGIEPDSASEGAGQLCYLPNRGDWYDSISQRDGVYFDPMTTWSGRIADLVREDVEAAAAAQAARDAARKRREALMEVDVGQGSQSLIGAFNATFSVEDVLVQAGYAQRGHHFRHPNSETGSFSASVKNGRVHTLSSADPLFTGGGGGGAHDAFSAFQVLFHQGDIVAALRDAGDNWLTIGADSWNEVSRRKFAEERRAERDSLGDEERPQSREFDYALGGVPHVEYGIDGFTSIGLTVIAGEAGLGKTSTIVPMAATVAHLLPGDPEDPFSLVPVLRRKVIYITEDAGQVNRLLYGLRRHRSQAPDSEFREWFHVFEAHRKAPADLAEDIRRWRTEYRYNAGPELNNYTIEPLIIVDTSNANIDLDNENDNAEVGKAIAAVKRALGDKGMAWLVAHLAKSVNRADIAALSVRGASAWVGDANATAYLITAENIPGKRFLILGKRRFEPEFTEIEVSSEVFPYHAETPWGRRQNLRYMVCDLKGLADRDRMAVQTAKARSEKYAKAIIDLLTSEYESALKDGGIWHGLTSNRIEKGVTGTGTNVRDALTELVNAGKLKSRTEGDHRTAPTYYWLPGQNRFDLSSGKNRRSSDEATQKTGPEGEPLGGGVSAAGTSFSYREPTKDEGGTLSGVTPPAFASSKSRQSADEAPTKQTKLEAEDGQTPNAMAKDSVRRMDPEAIKNFSMLLSMAAKNVAIASTTRT